MHTAAQFALAWQDVEAVDRRIAVALEEMDVNLSQLRDLMAERKRLLSRLDSARTPHAARRTPAHETPAVGAVDGKGAARSDPLHQPTVGTAQQDGR